MEPRYIVEELLAYEIK